MANELSNLSPSPGSTKNRMRVGRGEGSGKGKTAGRGTKGQLARGTVHPKFEGGQMPLQRRMPKRGFNNIHGKRYTEVRLDKIAEHFKKGETVDTAALKDRGVVATVARDGIKVLGNGDLGHALNIHAAKFTKSAAEKITAAGGSAEIA
jgi:large subunit ribosomal protein L15